MYVFVSDAYVENYGGGAELSTQGLIDKSRVPIIKLYSQQVTPEIIESLKEYHWVFTNTTNMAKQSYLMALKTLSYSVVEFDYKFCTLRSIEKHTHVEGKCRCSKSSFGKLFSIFLAKAKNVFWMSTQQYQRYCEHFPFLEKSKSTTLSSIFNNDLLGRIDTLYDQSHKKKNTYLILGADSWIKGTDDAILYAKNHNLEYEIISGLSYDDMLKKLSEHKGLIFHPKGADTCPRIVIETALLGGELLLNDNVQHKDEKWFTETREEMKAYLSGRAEYFWDKIHEESTSPLVPKRFKGSSTQKYVFIVAAHNAEEWIGAAIKSIKEQKYDNFRCLIGDDLSTDHTSQRVLSVVGSDPRFSLIQNKSKKYALHNIADLIETAQPEDDEIIVLLDGDDWLSNSHVLDVLNREYDNNALVTFGSFIEYPTGRVGKESTKYPENIVENNSFRQDQWRASHLRTLKYRVWKDIKKEDFCNDVGEFYKSSYDQAIMLPALELVGKRAHYVHEILCVYNIQNPNSVNKHREQEQYKNMLEIRAKKPYEVKSYD
tara:strand:- start:39 stop:1670 length:1632 start_codon:yes stop_codon:yes gene_type:complete